jgi:hypothetical protein
MSWCGRVLVITLNAEQGPDRALVCRDIDPGQKADDT